MRKIGVLGGTFDPPHKGHLKVAEIATKILCLDLLLFIPCNKHTLKERLPKVSGFHRSNMLALLCSNRDNFIVENCELERGGVSYTSETLSFLKKKYKDAHLYLLLGRDSYETLHLWKSPDKIRKLATVAVFPRGKEKIVLKNKNDIEIKMKTINFSSSQTREKLERNLFEKSGLTKNVLRYIKKEGLYFRKENG
ncbi:MAG: nicotinate (nicotinamide) nucleotide adenylyltransferase [Acidobacteriota bacterium]